MKKSYELQDEFDAKLDELKFQFSNVCREMEIELRHEILKQRKKREDAEEKLIMYFNQLSDEDCLKLVKQSLPTIVKVLTNVKIYGRRVNDRQELEINFTLKGKSPYYESMFTKRFVVKELDEYVLNRKKRG